jgi:hypothetical protein
MNELREIFPTRIVRGAVLRADGVAVGLVVGGSLSWDLLSLAARAQAGADYHRLLLALDAPIDVYLVDQPPDVADQVATLLERQTRAAHPLLETVLSEIADYMIELAQQTSSRAKQVIWAVTTSADTQALGVGGLDLLQLIRRGSGTPAGPAPAGLATLAQAVEKARRLCEALNQLGGTPPPRLLEAEEIARLLYGLADPVRAQRYPLAGTLLERVRRIVTPV